MLGENWETIGDYLHYLDYAVAVGLVAGAVYLFWLWRKARSEA
jgi:membrane protein DedA with SNARE-associated domain